MLECARNADAETHYATARVGQKGDPVFGDGARGDGGGGHGREENLDSFKPER